MRVSHIERFGIQRFQGSDEDIQFYTGLTFMVFYLHDIYLFKGISDRSVYNNMFNRYIAVAIGSCES